MHPRVNALLIIVSHQTIKSIPQDLFQLSGYYIQEEDRSGMPNQE